MKQARFLFVFVVLALALGARSLQAQVPFQYRGDYSPLLRAAGRALQCAVGFFAPSKIFAPFADGGSDGGGDDGGGGDGGDGSASAGAEGNGNSDPSNAADDSGVAAVAEPGKPDSISVPADPPTNDPTMSLRGGEAASSRDSGAFVPSSVSFPPGPPLGSGAVGQDVAIHAVIVSAVQSPWNAISKAPGVRNIALTGGLIALGKAPRPGETARSGPPPSFLKVIPNPQLLNRSIIPPVVPNVVDVRIEGYSVMSKMPNN